MKKVTRRSYSILLLALATAILMGIFLTRWATTGSRWVAFPTNRNVFVDGQIGIGRVYDRNGTILFDGDAAAGTVRFHDDPTVRRATFHALGDRRGSVATGALRVYAYRLIGYNLLDGVYAIGGPENAGGGRGHPVHLTIDAEVSVAAYRALDGRRGAVVVLNYQTGEILAAVSTPSYDPLNPPTITADDPAFEGVYLNRVFSSSFVPGSVFKAVTSAAALDTFADAASRTYHCNGVLYVGGGRVTCLGTHGTINMDQAMGHSCNIYFAQLALDLGGPRMLQYTRAFGLTTPHDLEGISVAAGNFAAAAGDTPALAWSGVGQSENLINPLSLARFMGAVARGGTPVEPRMRSDGDGIFAALLPSEPTAGAQMMPPSVANQLGIIMRSSVANYYGDSRFPGLRLAAKTGTAEVGQGRTPHAWFGGFIEDADNPLAFVVVVENGGGGLAVAGAVANTVLQVATR